MDPEYEIALLKEQVAALGQKVRQLETKQRDELAEDRILKTRATMALEDMGVPLDSLGFRCLRTAIVACAKDMALVDALGKRLYQMTAEVYGTTPNAVGKNLTRAISAGWDRATEEAKRTYFGNTVRAACGTPTNGEFIATLADRISTFGYLYDERRLTA